MGSQLYMIIVNERALDAGGGGGLILQAMLCSSCTITRSPLTIPSFHFTIFDSLFPWLRVANGSATPLTTLWWWEMGPTAPNLTPPSIIYPLTFRPSATKQNPIIHGWPYRHVPLSIITSPCSTKCSTTLNGRQGRSEKDCKIFLLSIWPLSMSCPMQLHIALPRIWLHVPLLLHIANIMHQFP